MLTVCTAAINSIGSADDCNNFLPDQFSDEEPENALPNPRPPIRVEAV